MVSTRALGLLLAWGAVTAGATAVTLRTGSSADPIRKVVTMLQMMQAKVTAEGKKAEELYDKYMCYCENADETLAKSIADAEAKIPQLESAIDEMASTVKQLESELARHKADRKEAEAALAEAAAMRKKEAGANA